MITNIFPILEARDVGRTLDLYCNWLGFERVGDPEEAASGMHAVRSGSVYLAFVHASLAQGLPLGRGVRFYFDVNDVEERYERVKRAGLRIVSLLEDKPYGMREFTVQDPNGYTLTFAQPIPS